jgi:hypothetical protein
MYAGAEARLYSGCRNAWKIQFHVKTLFPQMKGIKIIPFASCDKQVRVHVGFLCCYRTGPAFKKAAYPFGNTCVHVSVFIVGNYKGSWRLDGSASFGRWG